MMEAVHLLRDLNQPQKAEELYTQLIEPENENASSLPSTCYQCGSCELRCPERIKVIRELKFISDKFEKNDNKKMGSHNNCPF